MVIVLKLWYISLNLVYQRACHVSIIWATLAACKIRIKILTILKTSSPNRCKRHKDIRDLVFGFNLLLYLHLFHLNQLGLHLLHNRQLFQFLLLIGHNLLSFFLIFLSKTSWKPWTFTFNLITLFFLQLKRLNKDRRL